MNQPEVRAFQTLTNEEKVEFFLQGQKLLLEFHPNSPFVIHKHTLNERMEHLKVLAAQYQGLTYKDDNICILFNKIYVADENDPVTALAQSKFKPPHANYNGVSIDFVVFRKLKDCAEWCKRYHEQRIQHVLYVKNGKPQIYKPMDLMKKVFNLTSPAHPNLPSVPQAV